MKGRGTVICYIVSSLRTSPLYFDKENVRKIPCINAIQMAAGGKNGPPSFPQGYG